MHCVGAGLALLAAAGGVFADLTRLTCVPVASGLTNPLFVCSPPGDTARLFIIEQFNAAGAFDRGAIRILNLGTGVVNSTPFLTVDGLATVDEQGLLGLAFAPDYATSGLFFVYFVDSSSTLRVVRYHVSANPNIADAASATNVLSQSHPQDNHNGGWIAFGPDGYLYIAMGDGGGSGDPNANGQNTSVLLGKILRINVATLPYTIPTTNPFFGSGTSRQEIWAYGLRNPWRNAFDRATSELWIADVGQGMWEEINVQPAGIGGAGSARNYGWRCYEGNAAFNTSGCGSSAGMTFPIYTYAHSLGRCSITGGYVYRGAAIPELKGTYFFADYCTGEVFSLRNGPSGAYSVTDRTAELTSGGQSIQLVTSFGEDAAGELYIVCQTGNIFRIKRGCYANCDGSTGSPAINANDFQCFLNQFAAGNTLANCDESTQPPVLNILDFRCWVNQFAAGCS